MTIFLFFFKHHLRCSRVIFGSKFWVGKYTSTCFFFLYKCDLLSSRHSYTHNMLFKKKKNNYYRCKRKKKGTIAPTLSTDGPDKFIQPRKKKKNDCQNKSIRWNCRVFKIITKKKLRNHKENLKMTSPIISKILPETFPKADARSGISDRTESKKKNTLARS